MPNNVEIKARLRDAASAHAVAARLSGGPPQRIQQRDTFFPCARGRLKLRQFDETRGELIHYERRDAAEARLSDYLVTATDRPGLLTATLERALGVLGVVEKKRSLYLVGQTRVHLDEVFGLGDFLEFEVVLRPDDTEAEGRHVVEALMGEFGLTAGDLVPCAYLDLIA